MTHENSPEYYTLTSVNPYNGDTLQLGIYENIEAICAKLRSLNTSCGDEYRIECFHLMTQEIQERRTQELLQAQEERKREINSVND